MPPPYNVITILAYGSYCWVGSFYTLAEARMQAHLLTEARGGEYHVYDAATGAVVLEAPDDIPVLVSQEQT